MRTRLGDRLDHGRAFHPLETVKFFAQQSGSRTVIGTLLIGHPIELENAPCAHAQCTRSLCKVCSR